MGQWADVAKQTIDRVHSELPATATLAERKSAMRAAYPFGEREYSPYKTWCKKQREYLRRFEPKTEKTAPLFVSHLDKEKAKYEASRVLSSPIDRARDGKETPNG